MNSQYSISVHADAHPSLARIIIAGPWRGDLEEAKNLLRETINCWPSGKKVDFLVTCGAFLRFPWPDDFPSPSNNLFPPQQLIEVLRQAAQDYCHQLIDEEMRLSLVNYSDYITIGIDSRCDYTRLKYQVEFVTLIDLHNNRYYWTGKSYPDSPQETKLIRIFDLTTHFIYLPIGKVMILGCHDLKLFSNRGRKAAKKEWRKNTQRDIDILLEKEKPEVVLQHPHTTDRTGTWKAEWNEIIRRSPSITRYISSGLYYNWGKSPRSDIKDVQKNTKLGQTIDFIASSENNSNSFITEKSEGQKVLVPHTLSLHTTFARRKCFEDAVASFVQSIPELFTKKYTGKENCRINCRKWPKELFDVHYEFSDWPKKNSIMIEIQFGINHYRGIDEKLQAHRHTLIQKMPYLAEVEWDTTSSHGWHRLKFRFLDTIDSSIISKSMFILIQETKDIINEWLKSQNFDHY